MKALLTLGAIPLVSSILCGCGLRHAPTEREKPNAYRVVTDGNMTLQDAESIAAAGEAESFTARITYSSHESLVVIRVGDDLDEVVDSEIRRLDFLSQQFSTDVALEDPVLQQLLEDKRNVLESSTLKVEWVQYNGYAVDGAVRVAEATSVEAPDGVGTVTQPVITDWPSDAFYTPYYGTSTIYTSGTLQKIWLDSNSTIIISSYDNGLEVDTVIHGGSSNATCQTSGASSNMPGWYADTERLDGRGNTNCSIGTIHANQLQTNTLYWTWHPFGSFNTEANPYIDIQYQPKDWCPWVYTSSQCESNKPWCMCGIGWPLYNPYPTQYLLSYNYYDAPGQEISWQRD
jgi:hypothetical protein